MSQYGLINLKEVEDPAGARSPEVVRALEAGSDGLEFIAVGSSRPEGGDGVPVADWWTDAS